MLKLILNYFIVLLLFGGCNLIPDPNPDTNKEKEPEEQLKFKDAEIVVPVVVESAPIIPVVEEPEVIIPEVITPDWTQFSLRQKIAQMIMVRIRGDFYNDEHWYRKQLEGWIKNDDVGGVITFGGSVYGTFYNIQKFQEWANFPLLVAADYERGTGQWLTGGTLFPSNMAVAATGNTDLAFQQGQVTAAEAKALGVHISFSPVMDVNNNKDNPIINFRSYGDSPELVSKFGVSFIDGFQKDGLIACVKHYPGHGNTATDSHTSLPTILGSRKQLESVELKPFKDAVYPGVQMIMVGHIAMPGLDPSNRPASHSSIITHELLRDNWGFTGLIVTDAMEMGGLTKSAWTGESAIRTVEAGADILLLPLDVKQTIDAIEKAVNSGRITETRINESVARIWSAKEKVGLFDPSAQPTWENVETQVGIAKHKSIARNIAQKSITVVKDNGQLPVKPAKFRDVTHIILTTDQGGSDLMKPLLRDIAYTFKNVQDIFVNDKLSQLRRGEIIGRAKKSDKVLVTLLVRIRMDKGEATIDSTHALLLKELDEQNISFITMGFGSPYLPEYKPLDTYICAYGYGSVSQKAVANALFGRADITGKLPVDLDENHKLGSGIDVSERTEIFENIYEDIDFTKAYAVIDSAINVRIFPGAQIFIARDGNIMANRGFGHQIYDSSSPPITNQTIYDVASITKILATTPIAMRLISKKLISLDHTVCQYFPEFTGGGKESVNIKHLLTHTSGLKPFEQYFLDDHFQNKADILQNILQQELQFSPGTDFVYSDLGIILLGAILEKVTGNSLDRLARRYVFKPLQMNRTFYNPDQQLLTDIAPTEYDSLYRHKLIHGEVHDENAFLMGGVAAHAGVFSTARDIGNYSQMLLNEGTFLGKRHFWSSRISQFTKRQETPPGSDRALGFDTPSQNGKSSAGDHFSETSFGHLGYTGTSVWIDPEEDIIVVLLTNRVHPTRKRGDIYNIRRRFYSEVMRSVLKI